MCRTQWPLKYPEWDWYVVWVSGTCRTKHLYGWLWKEGHGTQGDREPWTLCPLYRGHSSKVLIHPLHSSLYPAAGSSKATSSTWASSPMTKVKGSSWETGFIFLTNQLQAEMTKIGSSFFKLKQQQQQPESRWEHYFQRYWLKIVQRAEKEWYL